MKSKEEPAANSPQKKRIVRVNRYFEANGTGYFVMDYESGRSLRESLSGRADQYTEQEIEAIIMPVCNGLEELHQANLIHRDIKPDNIIIRTDGSPVLIDFGAAAELGEINSSEFQVIATPGYSPIEQFDYKLPQGPWIDIYAIGATMYEMITGYPPHPSLERLNGETITPASVIGRGQYSDRLLGLIDKSLSLDYLERPESIKEFLTLLRIDDDSLIEGIIRGLSHKSIRHFLNWATPNSGLYIDELVAFMICFPIIDLSWRIGRGTPTKDIFLALYRTLDKNVLDQGKDIMLEAGFSNFRRSLTLKTLEARLDEYAATYLLDRQEDEWTYHCTCNQLAKNCLTSQSLDDASGFKKLMEDVIDRSRSRIKKEFSKAFRNVSWIKTMDGWNKEIKHFT